MSETYDIGDLVHIIGSFTGVDGEPADPTDIALTVRAPDGTVTAIEDIVNDATGQYRAPYAPTASGMYFYRWQATGALVAAEEGWFHVRTRRVPEPA